jgi:hypothetical protein
MRDQEKAKSTCLIRSAGVLLVVLAVGFLGPKFYTDWLVRQAETRYPPDKFVTVEGLQLHYVGNGVGRPVVFMGGGNGKVQDFTLSPLFDPVTENYHTIFIDRFQSYRS